MYAMYVMYDIFMYYRYNVDLTDFEHAQVSRTSGTKEIKFIHVVHLYDNAALIMLTVKSFPVLPGFWYMIVYMFVICYAIIFLCLNAETIKIKPGIRLNNLPLMLKKYCLNAFVSPMHIAYKHEWGHTIINNSKVVYNTHTVMNYY